jgi:hypothetical protein
VKLVLLTIYLFILCIFGACDTYLFTTKISPYDPDISFSGISALQDKTDSTVTVHWASHPKASGYEVSANGFKKRVSGQSTTSTTLSGLNPGSEYKIRVNVVTAESKIDTNIKELAVTLDTKPASPTNVSLGMPSYTPAINLRPTLKVDGVKAGDIIKIFTDASCTDEVASQKAESSSIDIRTNSLTAGAYVFYARAINSIGNGSDCSTDFVTYETKSCPVDYVPVPRNPDLGVTDDFCVSKYEMKNVADVATSQKEGAPWVSIALSDMLTKCQDLNALNSVINRYDLISNPEWMTMIRNAELVDENWSPVDGVQKAGVGILAKGHSDGIPNYALAASDDNDPYYGTGDNATSAWEQRRTHILSNGEVVWDLAGNVFDRINWSVPNVNKAYFSEDGAPVSIYREFNELDMLMSETDIMKPSTWAPYFISLSSAEGLGKYHAGAGGSIAIRGGFWLNKQNGGLFTLALHLNPANLSTQVGFRCVYRP